MSLHKDDLESFVHVYRRILEEQAVKQKIITDKNDRLCENSKTAKFGGSQIILQPRKTRHRSNVDDFFSSDFFPLSFHTA